MPRKRKPAPALAVIVDTREQAPYDFAGLPELKAKNSRPAARIYKGIPSGDYSLAILGEPCLWCGGAEPEQCVCFGTGRQVELLADRVAVERKSLIDLFGSVGRERDRFEREIARLNELQCAAVVIEATWPEICRPSTRELYWPSEMKPLAVHATIVSWSERYPNVHWHAVGDRCYGEFMVWSILRTFWRNQNERPRKESATAGGER